MRTLLKRLILAFAFVALPLLTPGASGQQPTTLNLDLNGRWDLVEHGEHLSLGDSMVRIDHTGQTVRAEFLKGAVCADGTRRSMAFTGQLTQSTVPGEWLLSSTDMWVCSGDADLRLRCGAKFGNYKTSFTNVVVTPDEIQGMRVAQGVKDCSLDSREDGEHEFTLKRLGPCEPEERNVKSWEDELLKLAKNIVGNARVVFLAAAELAEERYAPTFTSPTVTGPPSWVSFPYVTVNGSWDEDAEMAEEYFRLEPVSAPEWARARQMAAAMGFKVMLTEMGRVENENIYGQRALTGLQNARADLAACKARHP